MPSELRWNRKRWENYIYTRNQALRHTVAIWKFAFHKKIRLCEGDFEGKFQTSVQNSIINFLIWKFRFIIRSGKQGSVQNRGCLIFIEMDSDFALGMLKTISTFLDFFATIKFLEKQLQTQLLNFWISRQNLIRLHNELRSIFLQLHYWLRGYVGAWLAFPPGDWGSNLTWAKLFFLILIIIFK